MRGLPGALQPELVIVSPLRRTLETAVGIFGSEERRSAAWQAGEDGPPLMTAIEGEPDVRAATQPRSIRPEGAALLPAAGCSKWTHI